MVAAMSMYDSEDSDADAPSEPAVSAAPSNTSCIGREGAEASIDREGCSGQHVTESVTSQAVPAGHQPARSDASPIQAMPHPLTARGTLRPGDVSGVHSQLPRRSQTPRSSSRLRSQSSGISARSDAGGASVRSEAGGAGRTGVRARRISTGGGISTGTGGATRQSRPTSRPASATPSSRPSVSRQGSASHFSSGGTGTAAAVPPLAGHRHQARIGSADQPPRPLSGRGRRGTAQLVAATMLRNLGKGKEPSSSSGDKPCSDKSWRSADDSCSDKLWRSAADMPSARSSPKTRPWKPGGRLHSLLTSDCTSFWSQLPDTVLLQAIVWLGPGDVCATARCCTQWAETVTDSEAWLWSVIGGAGLPPRIFESLSKWASAARLSIRHALQLWLCRAHLWGGSQWTGVEAHDPVITLPWWPSPCDTAASCCGAWLSTLPDGGLRVGAAVGFASGRMAFCRLATHAAPTHGLRGIIAQGVEDVVTVPSAHGYNIITAVRPLGDTKNRVVSAGLDGLLRIWDPATATEDVQIVTELQRGANDVAVSPGDSPKLLCCGDDGGIMLYDPTAPPGSRPVQCFQGHTAATYCAAWASTWMCATGGFDRRALVWDSRGNSRGPVLSMASRQHVYALCPFGAVGSSSASTSLAVGLSDGSIAHWDLRRATKEPVREMRGHSSSVESLAALPGDILASASTDGTVRLWDAGRRGENTWVWHGGSSALTGIAAVLEDALLVTGLGTPPTVLSLDYGRAAPHVPEVLDHLQLPTLQPWRRAGLAPPEGHGRHSALLQQRRILRTGAGSGQARAAAAAAASVTRGGATSRGSFDRNHKGKPIPLGATGTAHRTFLFGSRR